MKTTKVYTVLCSGPLMNGSMLQELVCEGYDPEKARQRAKQKLDEEYHGNLFAVKMASQFQPAAVEYNYYSVSGVEVDDIKPASLTQKLARELCDPIAKEMGWQAGYIELLKGVCIVLPKNPADVCTEQGLYGFNDYRKEL